MEVPAGQEQLYGIVAGKPVDGRAAHAAHRATWSRSRRRARRRRGWRSSGATCCRRRSGRSWRSTKPGKGGEIQLTDALKELAQRGAGCYGLTVDGTRHDAGDKLGYLGANLAWALKRDDLRPGLLALMRALVDEAARSR